MSCACRCGSGEAMLHGQRYREPSPATGGGSSLFGPLPRPGGGLPPEGLERILTSSGLSRFGGGLGARIRAVGVRLRLVARTVGTSYTDLAGREVISEESPGLSAALWDRAPISELKEVAKR